MPLISLRNIHLGYGYPLLAGVCFSIEKGERIALVGRNGVGKSTLLKIISGELSPDQGESVHQDACRVARLEQEVPLHLSGSVFDVVTLGLGKIGSAVQQFHHLSHQLSFSPDNATLLKEMEECQRLIEVAGAWDTEKMVETLITRCDLPIDADITTLSGGLKRRVLLAKALIAEPDVLLLDEPTNHLDLSALSWLEDFLLYWPGALVFITHDRVFLQKLATRIVELDRGALFDFPGDYPTYLQRKEEQLEAEAKSNAEFDKKWAEEERWIRQGIKARRTRDMGRVKRLMEMREEKRERKTRIGQAKLPIQAAERSGKLVVEIENISFSYPEKSVVTRFSTTVLRGDKVGILGPNGCGKTTLLRLMLGQLTPTSGRIALGTQLQIAYFDQYRAILDEEASVMDNVAQGSDRVTVNGQNRHVMGYLQDFLFTSDRARQPVRSLSGGERNRLLLARLFTQPANLLVLDEPTNDLDTDTLELLESWLLEYSGTVLVVSHDRAFLNRLVTSVLVFEGEAQVNEYVGGYDDWVRQRPSVSVIATAATSSSKTGSCRSASFPLKITKSQIEKPRKLSYKEQKELDSLPSDIEALEMKLNVLNEQMTQPLFYQQPKETIMQHQSQIVDIEHTLQKAYTRWEALETLSQCVSPESNLHSAKKH